MTETTRPRRTQASRRMASQKKIIQEATRLFGENGFRGTRLMEIAAAVNMTEPGILHHFSTKENLLISVLQERDRIDQENFAKAFGQEDFDVVQSIKMLVEHNETVPGLVQLFTMLVAESIPSDYPSHEFFIKRYQSLRVALSEELRKAQGKGKIRNDIGTDELAILIFAMMDGLQIQWLLEPDSILMAKVFNSFVEQILGHSPQHPPE